jgi:hypothetical protein
MKQLKNEFNFKNSVIKKINTIKKSIKLKNNKIKT